MKEDKQVDVHLAAPGGQVPSAVSKGTPCPKHTPGEWFVGGDDRNGQAVVRGEHIEIATCWHHCVGSIEREMRANARLIAAAPDLLAACRMVTTLRRVGGMLPGVRELIDEIVKDAEAAIAKATGSEVRE